MQSRSLQRLPTTVTPSIGGPQRAGTGTIPWLTLVRPGGLRGTPVASAGSYGTIVAMCRADHADQAMDMGTFGNPG